MPHKQETFASLMESFRYKHDLRPVFDDFLTMSLCAFSQNPQTRKSYHEELYMETIRKYSKEEASQFPHLLAALISQMEMQLDDSQGNDVLGDYYGEHLYRKGAAQYFTPWHVCMMMAACVVGEVQSVEEPRPLRILDPCCGSGRMLLAAGKVKGKEHKYYEIDIDSTCVKMAAINLFLNGMFNVEVMCADALVPDNFKFSYRISFLPFGVFRIDEKERSPLWHLHKNSFKKTEPISNIALPSQERDEKSYSEGKQLTFF